MADILDFRGSPSKPVARRTKRRSKSAEIVIFPGIRYERWEKAPAEAEPPEAPAKKRDTLQLVDA